MARPRVIKKGRKLNLYLPDATIRLLFTEATRQERSLSSIVNELVLQSKKRKAEANGN